MNKPQQKPKKHIKDAGGIKQFPLGDKVDVSKLDWYDDYARKVREQQEKKE